MKIKILFATLFLVVVVSVAFHSHLGKDDLGELMLKNVEALASDEMNQGHCIGSGSIDCPKGHDKVEYVASGYSLEGFN